MNKPRPGFDISPLLNQEFGKVERDYVKAYQPDPAEDPEAIPQLLIHTLKRIHKSPSQLMILEATRATGLSVKQVTDVWTAMWERA